MNHPIVVTLTKFLSLPYLYTAIVNMVVSYWFVFY